MSQVVNKLIDIVRTKPVYLVQLFVAIARGTYTIAYYRLTKKKVTIGFPLKCFSGLRIIGDGEVVIGRNCSLEKSVFKSVSIVTLSPEAKVRIGNNCTLQGLTVRCNGQLIVGDNLMTALTLIQDTPIADPAYRGAVCVSDPECNRTRIGDNVWLGGGTFVFDGVTIGDDSVLASGSSLKNVELKDFSLLIGNPVRRPLPIDNLLKMKEKYV